MKTLIVGGEIHLFGRVIKDQWIWPEDEGLFSSQSLIEALSHFPDAVTIRMNSDGGDPEEGEAARAALAGHPGKTTVLITGAAHSAASLIAMGADEIVMSAGSLMLIHDPSAPAFGTAADFIALADELNGMAQVYAGVYAARAGITTEAARAIMTAETLYSAEDAVAAGFADRVSDTVNLAPPEYTAAPGGEAVRAAAMSAVMSAGAAMQKAKERFEKRGVRPSALVASDTSKTMGCDDQTPQSENANMTPEQIAAAAAAAVITPVAAVTAPAASPAAVTMSATPQELADRAVADERARATGIRTAAAPFMAYMSPADVDAMIADGTSLAAANTKIMAFAAAGQGTTHRSPATITRDEGETKVEGMIGAMMHRSDPKNHKLEGAAMDYRGLRVKSLAMTLAASRSGFDDLKTVKDGMRSTAIMAGAMGISDFGYITSEVLNRTLQAAYTRRPQTFKRISQQRFAADFRALSSVLVGGDFELKGTNESGEYLQSSITDEAGSLKLAKYGRVINLSFEAVVNDDMGVFERLPNDFARAGLTLENKIAWTIIRSNALASDGKAMFHADHGNIGGSGGVTVANVAAGRAAMFQQLAPGSKDKDDFIEVEANLLYVPPALDVSARQFVTATVPGKADDVNPYAGDLEVVTEARLGAVAPAGSDTRWYLFSEDRPVLEHAYLEGHEAPTVQVTEEMNPDGVNMVARHIFAAAPGDWRGGYRHGA